MSEVPPAVAIRDGDIALQPLAVEAHEAGEALDDINSSRSRSSADNTVDETVSPTQPTIFLTDPDGQSEHGSGTGTQSEDSMDRWQCSLGVTQTVLALIALVLVAYMIRPQLGDHAINKWTALKDFRDDCRAEEVRRRVRDLQQNFG